MEKVRKGSCSNILTWIFGAILVLSGFIAVPSTFASDAKTHVGETIYVPIYSFIYYGNKFKKIDLTATLSIRNTDMAHTIEVVSVDYYDSDGNLVKNHLENPIKLDALAATHFQVAESDVSGGLGASFVVRWKSDQKVSKPIVEGVMIGAIASQGISFVCRGETIRGPVD
ncbi:MAG: DUF3124 domain-containing protein [Desulfoferrobacter sp.]